MGSRAARRDVGVGLLGVFIMQSHKWCRHVCVFKHRGEVLDRKIVLSQPSLLLQFVSDSLASI
jgi:hypothetical protein